MDSAQWQQGIGVVRAADQNPIRPTEKKPRPEQVVNCPRCNSTNTKFCYYNNYSLSQPRYFCKTCRRYWTEGGTLRNVPVGGGSRRKHRPSSSSSSSKTDPQPKITPDHQNPKFPPIYNGTLVSLPFYPQNPNFTSTDSPHLSFMDLLKTTTSIPPVFDSTSVFPSGLHEIKPSSSFSLDRIDNNGFGTVQVQDQHTSFPSRTGFSFEEPKPAELERGLPLDSNGYWNGLLPSGGSWRFTDDGGLP